MRNYGLYDTTRGLTTALAAGVAGLLLWTATQVGMQTVGRFWAAMGIVAGAGLVLALAQAIGGWTKGLRMRVSPGTLLLGFLPVLVCVGWILLATQPGNGWQEGRLDSWSASIGISGLVHDLGLWHGVLAFGFGLVLGLAFDTVPAPVVDPLLEAAPVATPNRQPNTVPVGPAAPVDEPVTAERSEVGDASVRPRRRLRDRAGDR